MSGGPFTRARYQASYGDGSSVHPIRVQPETVTLSVNGVLNSIPVSEINNPISALVSRGRRSKGLVVRTVTLKAPATNPPDGYLPNGLTTVPCLTEAFYNACAAADDTTNVNYLNTVGYSVSYVSDEKVR